VAMGCLGVCVRDMDGPVFVNRPATGRSVKRGGLT
jgi:hypothetical protein